MAKLEEVCDILDSKRVPITASDRTPGPYPYYGANGVQDYVADYLFDDELVLLAEDGGNFGSKEKPIAYRVSGKCWVNNHAHVLKPKQGLNADYLCYSLMFYDVSSLVNGTTRQKLTQADMRSMEIPMRTLQEQEKIVVLLNNVTDLIALRKKQLQKLDDLVKARFVEMFGNPVSNSMSWEKQRFDSLCENLDGRRKSITSTDRISGPYPYYGASGIVDHIADYIFDEDILLISEDGANLLARSTPIAFSVKGKVWVNNHAHVLRFPDFALQKYIEYFFAMISIEDYITGSTQPKLNQAKLNAMMIPIPSKERMDAFRRFLEQVDKSKFSIQQSLEKLETLKQSLMQQYFDL